MASTSSSLTSLSFTPDTSFNWFFLLELIVSCILVLFFLLYFNRLFAALLSYAIRAYTWHYYRAYVDINAIQVSLLGGRVFFKGIRYHGANETIFVHGGFITWHYWKRAVKKTELFNLDRNSEPSANEPDRPARGDNDSNKNNDRGEQGGLKKTDALPCRITAKFYGLEWFIYNRTAAYDSILAGFGLADDGNAPPSPRSSKSYDDPDVRSSLNSKRKENQDGAFAAEANSDHKPPSENNPGLKREDTVESQDGTNGIGGSLSTLLQLLPLKLVCDKGAIVIGNENTRSVLTTTFDNAIGSIEACPAGPLDLYRQVFSFQLSHPIIQMRPNPDFKHNQLTAAKGLSSTQEEQSGAKRKRDTIFNYKFQKRRVWHSIRDLVPYFQTSVESFHVHEKQDNMSRNQGEIPDEVRWIGLSRYLDESSQDDHEEWNSVEYGRFSTLLDSPSLTITYFWDIAGCVGPEQPSPDFSPRKLSSDINGASAPEWGIDLKIEGGSVNYGPWADRERIGLQNVLFPNSYKSSQPVDLLAPGALRQSTVFKFRVELTDETTLRIPTREPSKDWQWKGRADAIRGTSKLKQQQQQRRQSRNKEGDKGNIGPDIRPFGWLSLRLAGDSTINYTMDMVASTSGYHNQLDLDLRDSRMSSSVNHGLLWQCPRQLLTCDLSNPLTWNALRTWNFNVESQDMELFLIRDHIFLITDLVTDWASGPPSDYYTFVPFIYNLNLSFSDIRLFVNVNDLNIISNPSDLDDNRFLVVKSKRFTSDVMIPLNKFKPEKSAVDFKLNIQDGGIDFLTPLWDTLHTFLQDKSAATLDGLLISGTYDYYSSTSPELTDTLILNIDGASPRLYLFGFLIQYFMTVRENYFGEEMHFKTLEEFQELAYPHEQSDTHNAINPNAKSNDLDVIVHVTVDNPCALLPKNIYDNSKFLQLTAASLEVNLRFTNYYMDLHFALAPLKVALESRQAEEPPTISDTQLFIDGLTIHGHRLFGLPPLEPTYVCNWDFNVGQIIGECSTEFLSSLLAALQSFDLSFDNEENKLPPLVPIVLHDVTFLRANLASIHISVLLDQSAFILSSGPFTTKFNDWANSKFSKRLSLLVPELSIAAVDNNSIYEARSSHNGKVNPLALFQTTIKLKMAQRQCDIGENRKLQQEHIKIHDERTQRTQWLLFDWENIDPSSSPPNTDDLDPPTIAIPSMPEPLTRHTHFLGSPSVRHFPGSKSNSSARSFLVSSDASSLKGGRKRIARSINSASSSPSQDDRVQRPAHGNDSMNSRLHTQATDQKASEAAGSNVWAMPNFSLHSIVLDTSKLPSQQVPSDHGEEQNSSVINVNQLFSPFGDDDITHTNFACEFPVGIKGFCTPEFLLIVSALAERLQPRHPVEIIDSLQKEVISDIVGYEKSIKKPNKSTAFAIRVPLVLLKLVNLSEAPSNNQFNFQDEYSVGISHLKTELRTKVERRKNDLVGGIKDSFTVHTAASNLSVSVKGSRADASQEKAEFRCVFGDLNFWLVTTPLVRAHLQMRSFDTITSTKSVEHLASLVRRTTTMFDSVTSSFKYSSSLGNKRLRFLIYFLTQPAADIPDPAFLTRISYVLRVAPTHLRQHDSWKIISRIRNVFNNLSLDQQQLLTSKCMINDISLPSNAKSSVLSSFDQWRAWDLAHVEKSYVMRRVWNIFETTPETPEKPVLFSSSVKIFRFLIDPGPKESDFIVQDLSTTLSISPQKQESQDVANLVKLIILQSYCSSVLLSLRWEILDLVEGIAKTMSTVTLESAASPDVPTEKPAGQTELQIVLGTDLGAITLDGINIKLKLVGKALRGSLVHKSHIMETLNEDLSLLFSVTECSSEISSLHKPLMLWRIGDPYIYCSRMSQESEMEAWHEWKVAGSCRKLRYEMQEDPLGLAHTADRLIEDEVRYIRRLVDILDVQKREPDESTIAKKKIVSNKFQIATFLGDYQLSFCLLPSLIYTISGEVARLSVMPKNESMIEVDFDLKQNSHAFSSSEGDGWHDLSVLDIPPINGRVIANMLSSRTEVEVDVTIELIRLEASAVRSLVSALTGPEISHLVSDLKQNVEALQTHLDDVLALKKSSSQPKEPSDNHGLLYKSRLTMAGTEIHATAPGVGGKGYSADMQFSLGMMRMRLDNGLDDGSPMEYPEFHVDASHISFDLKRQEKPKSRSYGSLAIDAKLHGTSIIRENGETARVYHLSSNRFDIELFRETASLVVDIAVYLQERIKTLDLSHEVQRFKKLRHRSQTEPGAKAPEIPNIQVNDAPGSPDFFNAVFSLEFNNIEIGWNMATAPLAISGRKPDDLVFSIKRVDLSNKRKNSAKLRIEDMQLQMVPFSTTRRTRSLTSALMPELVFNVAHSSNGKEMRLAFQAAGKSLDMRATSDFILPASMIRDSIASAAQTIREANALWATKPSSDNTKERNLFGNKRIRSVLVDVDFAGAIVSLQGRHTDDQQTMLTAKLKGSRVPEGKYGQYVQGEAATTATFRAPGVAFKVQFEDNGKDDPALNAELKVDASTNVLYPTLVPLIKQMTATVKELMGEQPQTQQPRRPSTAMKLQPQKLMQETPLNAGDPDSILGRCKVNLGLLIRKQEFSLSCQPIARVAATAKFDSVYVTVNTVQSDDHGRFVALSVAFNSLQASVKHVYSNESTASFEVKSMVMSLMNSKHLSSTKGIAAILRVSPMKVALNAKQVQDLLLFREIWLPSDDDTSTPTFQSQSTETQTYIVQRYQQVASTSAFPWNTTIAIEKLEIQLDLGSTLGKAQFAINDLWLSSKKTSDREQTLCISFGAVGIESKGRMSGLVELQTLKVRTSIHWPDELPNSGRTPLIQASISFNQLQAKVSFDYQPFLVAHIAMFYFLMYNVRGASGAPNERLFSILEGDKVQVFCTTLTASQSLALFQAWQRLAQDKQAAYEASLREVDRYLSRRSSIYPEKPDLPEGDTTKTGEKNVEKAPISLQTGVVVTIKTVNIGVFPSSLFDNQLLKLEANDAQARFDVSLIKGKIQSALGLTLGQLRVAFSGINRPSSADIEELSVHEIASRATGSRGGTILKVPRLVASMETWQVPGSHQIDYIFQSTFEGKVDVGWNYSRIGFIRDMWETHSRALASRLGKPLPPSAVQITGGPTSESDGDKHDQEKITAVVNVPQSRYTYTALEPPVIETPQLRDMGEATPPLEWIGLQRDKLPNVTHQIIIVTLLEIAKEVEDAYAKILGSS
ncbi:hypothetical protein ASPWEDRAFT_32140 [Aspergillus wentii DTO 134E9]|uniref:Elongation factor 2 n=1 Tax=Aspergillus wentii DTO 134E9 TaxID=1073089 RepID=A0A1L9R9C5_ASPWE|nr:uncharacterized protein ASPWEDRAFT_32140 [Aspergillus wentii DTO 134E9]KAI9926454.1 hypothetical protein MW887_004219 [Aspergillus wentii]OJJ31509.1 hypothetical protein ASPWEDRAFT_32140 [Aspergillus wentii DTO 134E9]